MTEMRWERTAPPGSVSGNTPTHRSWGRSIFGSADADHVLDYIIATDDECKSQLWLRDETKPAGFYLGFVSEELFEEITFCAAIR